MHLPDMLRAVAVLAGSAVAVIALQAGPAAAEEPGLAWDPASGSDSTPLEIVTTGPCPASASNVVGVLYGAGFPRTGQLVIGNTEAGVSSTGPFSLVLGDTLRGFAALQPRPVTFAGTYRLVVTCREPLDPTSRRDFVGTVVFSTPGSFTARQPRVLPRPATEPAAAQLPGGPSDASGTGPGSTGPGSSGAAAPGPAGRATGSGPLTGAEDGRAAAGSPSATSGDRPDGGRVAPGRLLLGAGLLLGLVALVLAELGRRRGQPAPRGARTTASAPDHPAAAAAGAPSRPISP